MCSDTMRCPICENGNLSSRIGKNTVSYKGQTHELDLHFSVCDFCGSEQSDAIQVRDNKRLMLAFKKRVDGLLIGAEVRALRLKLNLSQAEASKLFGGGPVAFSKYESDDVMQSEAMDKLLRLAGSMPSTLSHLGRQSSQGGGDAPKWTNTPSVAPKEERHSLKVLSSSKPNNGGDWRRALAA